MRTDSGLKPFKLGYISKVSDRDMDTYEVALLGRFPSINSRLNVLFLDKCAIYLGSEARNIYLRCRENSYYSYYEEIELHPPHVIIWAAISTHLIGHTVNLRAYLNMFQT
jgi:hypothetical protein